MIPLLFLFGVMVTVLPRGSAEEAGEYWMKYLVTVKVNETVGLFARPQFRFRNDFNDYYFMSAWAGSRLRIFSWLEIAPQYCYKTTESASGRWTHANYLACDLTPKIIVGDLKITDRSRVMYGLDDYIWIYRNRIKIAYSFKNCLGGHGLVIFTAAEGFWNDQGDGLFENRWETGVGAKLVKEVGLDISYIYRNKKKSGNRVKSHIICSLLKFQF